ncbi:hypothetical protein [Absiella sp. AM29-15]|uniref:hypothetical protein n=1 Tax=Absiella sp. AM29-15 TaxID=2292278 RepID=UPI000E4089B2|nr:hypothetical protein [Absiella sp. AM29-15]RGC49195.1 hypothetical protein DW761_13835 [Absiella sp. AM29-15]
MWAKEIWNTIKFKILQMLDYLSNTFDIKKEYIVITFMLIVIFLVLMIILKVYKKYKIKKVIRKCKSKQDLKIKRYDSEITKINKQLNYSKDIIRKAEIKGYITVNNAWRKRFNDLNELSNILQANLEYEIKKHLEKSKFHRYTNLHFRCMLLGNQAYDDYKVSKKQQKDLLKAINQLEKKNKKVKNKELQEYKKLAKLLGEASQKLYEEMVELQTNTAKLRDKIRDECGKRGREWYEKNINHRK